MTTVNDLYQYRALAAEFESIQNTILALYDPVKSPSFDQIGTHSQTPGDPTARAVSRIETLTQELEQKREDLGIRLASIESMLNTVQDPKIRAIIRLHFINGLTWNETASRIYKNSTGDSVRKYFKRWAKSYESEITGQ